MFKNIVEHRPNNVESTFLENIDGILKMDSAVEIILYEIASRKM